MRDRCLWDGTFHHKSAPTILKEHEPIATQIQDNFFFEMAMARNVQVTKLKGLFMRLVWKE
jgi:hypothetical protein